MRDNTLQLERRNTSEKGKLERLRYELNILGVLEYNSIHGLNEALNINKSIKIVPMEKEVYSIG